MYDKHERAEAVNLPGVIFLRGGKEMLCTEKFLILVFSHYLN